MQSDYLRGVETSPISIILYEKYEVFGEMSDMIDLIVIDTFENNLPVSYRENSPKSSESGLAVSLDRMS
jgi:hypothetical protein